MDKKKIEKYNNELEKMQDLDEYYKFLMMKLEEKDFVIAQLITCCKTFSEQITELYENINLLNEINGIEESNIPDEVEVEIDYETERKKMKESGYFA